jgi:hypothetical protein
MWDDFANSITEAKGDQPMISKYYTISFVVDQSPKEVFDAVNNVCG